ncbi:hypothetical protein CEXT_69581 [Caerostris extrusa]|uniref:Uncharacterized protein n=1 Tax=Caerostris extrusa TaxID=172846 RepID=A0AAV4TEM6_CAEEX|nr:hypothetical protein CEXT_69581 [Caerostris extrusa]
MIFFLDSRNTKLEEVFLPKFDRKYHSSHKNAPGHLKSIFNSLQQIGHFSGRNGHDSNSGRSTEKRRSQIPTFLLRSGRREGGGGVTEVPQLQGLVFAATREDQPNSETDSSEERS